VKTTVLFFQSFRYKDDTSPTLLDLTVTLAFAEFPGEVSIPLKNVVKVNNRK
jgi:hypothetical protein